ncbi:MAG: hypothetical protein AB8G23_16900 [Myxococcota bacterium]
MTSQRPDEAAAPRAARLIDRQRDPADMIRFGTSGWRGNLGEEVTFPRMRRLVRGIADWLRTEQKGHSVLVGWDGRFASRLMAERTAHVLVSEGLKPILASRLTPTPAMTHAMTHAPTHAKSQTTNPALRGGKAAAALVLTASHNPAQDHGLKVFTSEGAAVSDAEAAKIEAAAEKRRAEDRVIPDAAPIQRHDFTADYERALERVLDAELIASAGIEVVYDAMHGAGGSVLGPVLTKAGAQVQTLRGEPDPYFGGGLPDPQAGRLDGLCEQVRDRSLSSAGVVGLATDGDADRLGVVDATGRVLTETQMIALLVDYLAETGRVTRSVAITEGTGSLVERVAAAHGLPVHRYPVGFKHLSAAMAAGDADVAGEESGGFALAQMGLDKDGLLAGLLIVEMVAHSGEGIAARLARLESQFGASACGRDAAKRTGLRDAALDRLAAEPPNQVGGVDVVSTSHRSGFRLGLADEGFLIFRRSGTEALIRVYAESGDPAGLRARLDHGLALLDS